MYRAYRRPRSLWVSPRQAAYFDYLDSATWARKRKKVHARSGGRCERGWWWNRCRNPGRDVHHRWYPRVLGTEPLSALEHVCEEHHDWSHHRGSRMWHDLAFLVVLFLLVTAVVRWPSQTRAALAWLFGNFP